MDNQENPSVQANVQPKEPDNNREQSHPYTYAKKTSFLVLFLGITTILASALAGIFAYQTQRLTKEISSMQTAQIPSTPSPTQTPDVTSDWTFFTRETFSFKYPNDWIVDPQADPSLLFSAKSPDYIENTEPLDPIIKTGMAITFSKSRELEKDETIENVINQSQISPQIITDRIEIEISNRKAIRYEWRDEDEFISAANFIYNNFIYIISISHTPEGKQTASELLDQILSTFQFIK